MNRDKLETQRLKLIEDKKSLAADNQILEESLDSANRHIVRLELDLWDTIKMIECVVGVPWYMPWKKDEIAKKAIYGKQEFDGQGKAI